MLQPSTLDFLRKLKKNNNKPWFDANRKLYEAAKADTVQLADALLKEIVKFDPTLGHLSGKQCLFRINRDVRFSKNKDPYKTNFGISMARGGKSGPFAGYYFQIDPNSGHFAGGGLWMPMPDVLKKVRQEIDYNLAEWQGIVESKKFKAAFGEMYTGEEQKLSRPPKGYEADNPAIEYLKLKSFIAMTDLTNEDITSKGLVKKLAGLFATMHPMVVFLNRAQEGE
jgi:uncharacterized protein (TIGR02453 family)